MNVPIKELSEKFKIDGDIFVPHKLVVYLNKNIGYCLLYKIQDDEVMDLTIKPKDIKIDLDLTKDIMLQIREAISPPVDISKLFHPFNFGNETYEIVSILKDRSRDDFQVQYRRLNDRELKPYRYEHLTVVRAKSIKQIMDEVYKTINEAKKSSNS